MLVPPRDRDALAAGLIAVLQDGDRAAELGRLAQRRQADLFTLDRMVEGVMAVYDEVLGSS
jgi:glycosyltransferase involved in cell wall biosynthesis